LEAVRDDYLAVETEAAKVGLKINEQKTTYLIGAGNATILDVGQTVGFGDRNFKVVNEFVYLGHRRTTWVWRYSDESKLQIGASGACLNICSHLN
jgi:hypothetical protein